LDQNNIEKGWGGGLFVPFCLKGIVVMHKCLETGGTVSTLLSEVVAPVSGHQCRVVLGSAPVISHFLNPGRFS